LVAPKRRFKTDKELVKTPTDFNLLHEEFLQQTQKGIILQGWKIYAKQKTRPKGTILLFNSDNTNMSREFIPFTWLTRKGYDLMVFDYRGFGKSTGMATTEGMFLDAQVMLDFGIQWGINRSTQKFIVYGKGLGGILAAKSIAKSNSKKELHLLVLESSPSEALQTSAENLFPNMRIPKLIIHGTDDKVVSVKESQKIHRLSAPPKWYWEVDQGTHANIFQYRDGRYRQKFLDFLANEI
jgi:alpha-beta hydrolase superfamily lysophospholipase